MIAAVKYVDAFLAQKKARTTFQKYRAGVNKEETCKCAVWSLPK